MTTTFIPSPHPKVFKSADDYKNKNPPFPSMAFEWREEYAISSLDFLTKLNNHIWFL